MTNTTRAADIDHAIDELHDDGWTFYRPGDFDAMTREDLRTLRRGVTREITDAYRGGASPRIVASILLQHGEIDAEQIRRRFT